MIRGVMYAVSAASTSALCVASSTKSASLLDIVDLPRIGEVALLIYFRASAA